MGFNSIGIIRGEKHTNTNLTLSFCEDHNMVLHYLDRYNYRHSKYAKDLLIDFKNMFGDFYLIPEGGNNLLGVKGCEEILTEVNCDIDYICCSVGTGCTASGLIRSMKEDQCFIGFSPFNKITEQKNSILKFCNSQIYNNWQIFSDNHFGGFSKINDNLIKFISQFHLDYSISLDLIYMGKLFYSLFDLIEKDFFS